MLYGLYQVQLVITGRARATARNLPAALTGLGANVALLFLLVPDSRAGLGIAGAGIALCGGYLAMLAAMHLLTRGLLGVRFEWRRLALLAAILSAVAVSGELLLPTSGAAGFVLRVAWLGLVPALLWLTRFFAPHERAHAVAPRRQPANRARGRRRVVLSHVQVAVAAQLDDAPLGASPGRELLVVDGRHRGHVDAAPARVAQATREVDLVRIHEEVAVEVAHLGGRDAPDEQRRRLAPVDLARALAAALHGREAVQEECPRERGRGARKAPRARAGPSVGREQLGARARRARALLERIEKRLGGARAQLGVLVEEQREAPTRALQQ